MFNILDPFKSVFHNIFLRDIACIECASTEACLLLSSLLIPIRNGPFLSELENNSVLAIGEIYPKLNQVIARATARTFSPTNLAVTRIMMICLLTMSSSICHGPLPADDDALAAMCLDFRLYCWFLPRIQQMRVLTIGLSFAALENRVCLRFLSDPAGK